MNMNKHAVHNLEFVQFNSQCSHVSRRFTETLQVDD
jgi:hypothetical protein